MADRVLFISWGATVRGREERGLEVFSRSLDLYGRMQRDGRIERVDVVLLEPNGGLNGYLELHGSAEQLAAARHDEEFERTLVDASLIVDDLRLVEGATEQELARRISLFQEAVARVPQMA
jgi:hypothetical protein